MSANVIKLIASVLMLLSHVGNVFGSQLPPWLCEALILIGRPVFPIFAYFLAEGWDKTSSKEKYLLRLGIFAVVSILPFQFAFYPDTALFTYQSVISTFFLAAVLVYSIEQLRKRKWIYAAVVAAVCLFMLFIRTDYDIPGILIVTVLCLLPKHARLWGVAASCALIYLVWSFSWVYALAALTALIPLALYNGEKGLKLPRHWFYLFYPLHLAVLIGIRIFIGGNL